MDAEGRASAGTIGGASPPGPLSMRWRGGGTGRTAGGEAHPPAPSPCDGEGGRKFPFAGDEEKTSEAALWRALESVEDPELPINIVDLGLVYGLSRAGGLVEVKLTFTAMGCPCVDFIIEDVRKALRREPGVEEVAVEIVWDPPWNRDKLSEKAVAALRTWGIAT